MNIQAHVDGDRHTPATEQLPTFPSGWRVARLRHAFNFNKGLTITKENLQDEGIPCVSYGEVHSRYGFEVDPERHPLKCVDPSYLKNNRSSLLRRGDFVFADTSEDIEGSGNFTCYSSDRQAFAGYHTLIAKPKVPMNFRFMAYLFDSVAFRKQVQTEVKGVKVFSISQAVLKPALVWFPPEKEQRAIAGFLDEKCAKVDEAVRIKQTQIALLRERRQILIQQAVTRGLNPSAPMKDSGVDWIGQIPAHWEVNKLKFASKIFRGKFTHRPRNDPRLYDGHYPFFQTGDVARAGMFLSDYRQTLNELGLRVSTLIPKGTILITIAANIGDVTILDIDGCFPDSVVGFRPSVLVERDFLFYSMSAMKTVFMNASTANAQANLNVDRIGGISITLPPKDEQLSIIKYIETSNAKIDDAIAIKQKQIAALKEYKTSLINAAVTGKIKVA